MGKTLGQWEAKVSDLIKDRTGKDVSSVDLLTVAISPALAQYSADAPHEDVEEQAGTGSPYLALPSGWVDGFSRLTAVEYPARQNPPRLLDAQSYQVVRDPTVVATKKILLDRTPTTAQFVRLYYRAPWPTPTATASDDLIDAVAFEAVSALAASLACMHLLAEASRSRQGAIPTDFMDGRDRARSLSAAVDAFRSIYDSLLGLNAGDEGSSGTAPAFGHFDWDPQRDWSIFHGGRR